MNDATGMIQSTGSRVLIATTNRQTDAIPFLRRKRHARQEYLLHYKHYKRAASDNMSRPRCTATLNKRWSPFVEEAGVNKRFTPRSPAPSMTHPDSDESLTKLCFLPVGVVFASRVSD